MHKSLTFRITLLSIGWVALTLLVTSLMLSWFYEDHIQQHYDAHVASHLEELVASSRLSPDGQLFLTSQPSDPRFHQALSGWYWEIRGHGETIARSESLGNERLELDHDHVPDAQHVHAITGPNQQKLRLQVLEFTIPGGSEPVTYMASAPIIPISADVENFESHVRMSLLLLGSGLLIAIFFQLKFALRPLNAIGKAIQEVREGKRKKLPDDFPRDVQPLTDELNRLLAHNAFVLRRARNQLGDLAHAVKNPLTVLNNEAASLPEDQKQLVLKQLRDISASIEHYLKRARTYGREGSMGYRTAVKPVAEDLAFVLQRTYKQRDLDIEISGLDYCWFGGEAQDLEEMLGNLLDNACKWASKKVWLRGSVSGDRLRLIVEDDGPGIPEEFRKQVLRRGFKLEQDARGHGLGLAIVREIVELYGGSLELGSSAQGGLRAELDLGSSG